MSRLHTCVIHRCCSGLSAAVAATGLLGWTGSKTAGCGPGELHHSMIRGSDWRVEADEAAENQSCYGAVYFVASSIPLISAPGVGLFGQ